MMTVFFCRERRLAYVLVLTVQILKNKRPLSRTDIYSILERGRFRILFVFFVSEDHWSSC